MIKNPKLDAATLPMGAAEFDEFNKKFAKYQKTVNDALKEYEKRRKKIEDEYEEGKIDEAERDRRLNNATRKLEKARDDAAKKAEAEQKRQGTRNALGVDSLMESLKSPLQKYRETLDEIGKALKDPFFERGEQWERRAVSVKKQQGIHVKLRHMSQSSRISTVTRIVSPSALPSFCRIAFRTPSN